MRTRVAVAAIGMIVMLSGCGGQSECQREVAAVVKVYLSGGWLGSGRPAACKGVSDAQLRQWVIQDINAAQS